MGAADFPLPRNELPKIEVSPREHAEAKELADHMLAHTVLEFEKFVYRDNNHVDTRLWKTIGSRDRLKLYKQREGGLTHAVRTQRLDSMSELPTEAINAAADPGSLMLTGFWPGRMENAMYAVVTKSQEELALVVIYLHEDVADCAILHTMEGQTADKPYHFLGYKFFVRKSPTNAHIVRNRDSVYLESCGLTKTSRGEVIGYHIMHSVDIPGFPDLTRRNSVRTRQSVRYIYRQKAENVVEIFMLGSLSIAGTLGGFRPVSTFFTADSLFGITRLVDCAEVKRLTACVRERQRNIELLERKQKGADCMICRSRKKLFTAVSLSECRTCGQFVCQRCWLYKKIFIGDGVLGRFQKICVCKTCVLDAHAGDFNDPIHVSLTRRQHHSARHRTMSSSGSDSVVDSCSYASSSDSGSVYSSEPTVSLNGSATPSSSSTQQAYYHTQFDRNRVDSSGGSNASGGGLHRIKRVGSRSGSSARSFQPSPLPEDDYSRLTLADVSSDLIPLDTEAVSRESMAMVVHESYPHSLSVHDKYAESVASTHFFTPPSESAIAYGVPVGSYDDVSYGMPVSLSRAPSVSSARAPSTTSSVGSGPEHDLFKRMLELHRVAESTYNTTKENAAAIMGQRY